MTLEPKCDTCGDTLRPDHLTEDTVMCTCECFKMGCYTPIYLGELTPKLWRWLIIDQCGLEFYDEFIRFVAEDNDA